MDGYLGDKIYMRRGIRQGDPASGYLFNLAVEQLASQISKSNLMQGITLSTNNEIRLSQYADGLILFLDGRPQTSSGAIHEIQTLTSFSGLK